MRTRTADPGRPVLAALGLAILVIATAIFVWGIVLWVSGNEAGFIPMIFAFGIFTFGIGVVTVARRH
jgi:hypothetical protein